MKKKLIVVGLMLLGLGIFAGVLSNAGWQEIWTILSQMTFGKFLLFLALTQISYALFNLRWQIILKTHGHKIPFWRLWLYRASGYGVSYITPTQVGGEPVRIYLLHENEGVRLREATASVLLDKLIELSTFIAFVASGVIVISFTNILPEQTLYSVLGLLGGFALLGGYIFKKLLDGSGFFTSLFKRLGLNRVKRIQRLEKKIYRTERLVMDFLAHNGHKKTTLPVIIFISIAAWSATIVEYYILAQFLGVTLTGFQSFLVGTVPLMAYLLPVPGGLGMLEGAQAGMFNLLGYSSSLAFAVVVMVRVKEMFFSSIGFGYALSHGLTLLGKEKQPEKESLFARTTRPLRRKKKSKKTVKKPIRLPT